MSKYYYKIRVSVHLIEKGRHFVSPKTLLRFRVRVRAEVSVNTFSIKRSRSVSL